ncbi:MAG: type I methionyl aminopeptidase, partial [Rhabdochlamydiaceae bacterium]
PAQIMSMQAGGKILSDVVWEVCKAAKPGVSELELDSLAERLIRGQGGEPGFMKVPGYSHTICACTNNVVVHGIPRDYRLQEGDIIDIDCGVFYEGFHTDMCETVIVKNGKLKVKSKDEEKIERFLQIGKKALNEATAQAKGGNRIGHISKTIESIVEREGGYSVVLSLIGHGVGRKLHEDPEVPGYLDGPVEKTPLLKPGMTIAIEVIYNMGQPDVVYSGRDDWTIVSKDGSLSAVFERSVAITDGDPIILTP